MKRWPPLPAPSVEPLTRRRIPCFHPVPVGARSDGWTPRRQAEFVGLLAETRSVIEACRRLGMGRESAYRLRKRPGAAGFAAAWDAALGKPHQPVDLACAKATGLSAAYRNRAGLLEVAMDRGRLVATNWKDDDNALLQHLSQLDRGSGGEGRGEGKSQPLEPPSASTPGPDLRPDAPG